MNIKLSEWNELVGYGYKLCNELKEKGFDVRIKPYSTYDGRKGLSMQVYDNYGNFFTEYLSGVESCGTMKAKMYLNAERIVKDC